MRYLLKNVLRLAPDNRAYKLPFVRLGNPRGTAINKPARLVGTAYATEEPKNRSISLLEHNLKSHATTVEHVS